jgi:hypothetical protein
MAKRKKDSFRDHDFSFFEVDIHQLDKEWMEQPALFFEWAERLADTRRDLDEAKSELDVTKAEISRAIRDEPEDYGLEKVTEAAVTAAIPEQEEYKIATKAVSEAKHAVDVYQGVVTALEHRKRALEKLVDLHGQSYFANPRVSNSNASEAKDEIARRRGAKRGVRQRKKT